MKSEFYIINLIQTDADVRRKVARYFGFDGSLEPRELIAQLCSKNLFRIRSESIFEDVRETLESALLPSSSPVDDDLRLLLQAKSQRNIAKLLNCSPSESIQTLFSPDELADILQDVGVQRPSGSGTIWDDSEFLLSLILDKKAKLQAAGITDLFGELNSRLRANIDRDLAQRLKCHEDDSLEELIRSLKATQNPSSSGPRLAGGVEYDIVAISKLRTYIHDFRERLLRESVLEGTKAQARLPGHRAPNLLVGLIEFCFGGNYKTGLNHLLSSRQLLRERITEKLSESSSTAGMLEMTIAPLERADAPAAGHAQGEAPAPTQMVRAEIHFKSSANAKPLPIIAIGDMTRDEAEQVEHHLEKSCEKLSPIGANLYERILNTPVPIFSRWRRTLYAIMKNRGADGLADSFVQCFVLSGVSFDAASLVPRLRASHLENVIDSPRVRLEFPKSASEIAAFLEEEGHRAGRNVNRIGVSGKQTGQR